MTFDPGKRFPIRFGLLPRVLATADAEADLFERDPYLRQALTAENRIGQRIAGVGRQTAVIIIACLLPFLNPSWGVLYYEALLLVFYGIGQLRRRFARVGQSRVELVLILADILLLTFIAAVPNPFVDRVVPDALGFRFGTFIYLFIVLAFATLSFSWRTVWTIGVTVAVIWLGAVALVAFFGRQVPELSAAAQAVGLTHPDLVEFLDLNDVQWSLRVQEVVIFIIVAGALTLKGWRTNQLILRQAQLAGERAALSRYFAPTMVDMLAAQGHGLGEARRREIAVMFVDLVGFSRVAETQPDTAVLDYLRRYYAEIERVVFDHGGTLDKYLGDGVMATFGTPEPSADDAANAARAARAIVAAVDAVDLAGLPPMRVSVGVHFGPATIGDVGPSRRLEFAVIGDTVNVAARLEAATRDLGCRILMSDTLVARLGPAAGPVLAGFARHDDLLLRGRQTPLDVWVLSA